MHSWHRVRRLDAHLYTSLVILVYVSFMSTFTPVMIGRRGFCTNIVPMAHAPLRDTVRSQMHCVIASDNTVPVHMRHKVDATFRGATIVL